MNDESRPPERLRQPAPADTVAPPADARNPWLAITAALEALEAGDVDYAVAILLGALEDGPAERLHVCRVCSAAFEWPGLLVQHEELRHAA
jgi:hypothetical protein